MLKLSFRNEKYEAVALTIPRLTIGRDAGNDLVLQEDGISGLHAEIIQEDANVILVDKGSTNGTLVNRRKITGCLQLKAWDLVRFDKIEAEAGGFERGF